MGESQEIVTFRDAKSYYFIQSEIMKKLIDTYRKCLQKPSFHSVREFYVELAALYEHVEPFIRTKDLSSYFSMMGNNHCAFYVLEDASPRDVLKYLDEVLDKKRKIYYLMKRKKLLPPYEKVSSMTEFQKAIGDN
jgi:hypothetical protein